MMELSYLQVFQDKFELLEPFSLEERGELFTAMGTYTFTGEELVLETNARYIWPVFRQMIDQSRAAVERLTNNGKKGGRPKTQDNQKETPNNQEETKENLNETYENQEETKEKPTETYENHYQESRIKNHESRDMNHESRDMNQDSKEKEREGGEAPPTPPKRKRFTPPTVDEVDKYCKERGNGVNAQHFVDFYAAKGWKVGSQPMKDWRAAVRTWEQRDDRTRQALYPPRAPSQPKAVTQAQYTQRPHKYGQALKDAQSNADMAKAYDFSDELFAVMAGIGG